MKSYETKKCNNDLLCGEDLVCGSPLTLQDDMQEFVYYNVGHINSGWIPTTTETGDVEYLYINVENVTSDTLDIIRIRNDIIVNIPNVYGTKLDFNAENGTLKLIGQNEKELSSVELVLGKTLISIETDDEQHKIIFKFSNDDDIVIDLVEVLGGIEGLTNNKISTDKNNRDAILKVDEGNVFVSGPQGDLPLYPDLDINDSTTITLNNNMERTYGIIAEAVFTLPEEAGNQGFCAIVVFKTGASAIPNIEFINNTSLPIVYIKDNDVKETSTEHSSLLPKDQLSAMYQYNLFILCNGVNIEIYIQEINI